MTPADHVKIVAQLKAAASTTQQFQAEFAVGSAEWCVLESIDDRLRVALTLLDGKC